MSKKRRNHSPDFKAKVALAAIKGDETLSELSQRFGINANLIVKWKKLLLEQSSEVFASGKGLAPDRESEPRASRFVRPMGSSVPRSTGHSARAWIPTRFPER